MHGQMECCFKSCMNPQVCFRGLTVSICKQMTHFVSIRYTQLICQQSPKLALIGSNMGLVLTVRVYLITKLYERLCLHIEPASPKKHTCEFRYRLGVSDIVWSYNIICLDAVMIQF